MENNNFKKVKDCVKTEFSFDSLNDQQHVSLRRGDYSEEVSEMLGKPPAWIQRWSIFSILLAIILGLTICYIIKYPVLQQGRASIIAIQPFTDANGNRIYIAEINITAKQALKVRPGQIAKIEFDNYPSTKYGFIAGSVRSVTRHSNNNELFYTATIPLVNGLTTSKNYTIPPDRNYNGTGHILTEERRILTSVFSMRIPS